MSSEVASESTWKPLPGSNRVLSRSSSDEELHQSLLDAGDGSEQPRRRSSIQGQHMPQIRVPMRARLEQVWPKLRLLNKLLLPIGALLAAAGGGCAWALNGCRGIDSWLLESGGVIVGLPLLLDIVYLAALAPYGGPVGPRVLVRVNADGQLRTRVAQAVAAALWTLRPDEGLRFRC